MSVGDVRIGIELVSQAEEVRNQKIVLIAREYRPLVSQVNKVLVLCLAVYLHDLALEATLEIWHS